MKRIISVALCAVMVLLLLAVLPQNASAASLTNFNIRLNEPVASYSPDFSPEFNTSTTVYSNVTWQENSPGFNMKLNSSDEFKAGLAYKVEIWIRLGDGNYFPVDGYGDLATAITVNGKAISSLKIEDRNAQNQITEVTITCEYDPLAGREISSVMITGIPTPVEGRMPIYSFTVGSQSYDFYHTAPVVWWDMTTGEELDSADTFIKGHKYQVNIWIQANREGGFTFKVDQNGNPQVNVVLNSWAADKVTKAYEQDGREVIDIRYTFPACQAAHTCAPQLVKQQDPTCLMPGFKAYYACSCGKNFSDAAGKNEITDMDGYGILAALGHTEGKLGYNGTHHYKKCTRCQEIIPGTNAAHTGGKATCVEKGKCTVCGYAYLPENENHTPDSKWTACAGLYHAHLCKLCGAHCDPQDHVAGPAATEQKPQTCKVCGYIMAPAKNHTHKLTQVAEVAPTCTAPGKAAYYSCDGCSNLFKDDAGKQKVSETELVIPAQGHQMSNEHGFDDQNHWYLCVLCKEAMTDTQEEHKLEEGKCSVCGYGATTSTEPTEATEPVDTTETTQPSEVTQPTVPVDSENKDGGMNWLLPVLIGLVCFATGITAAILILKKKQ